MAQIAMSVNGAVRIVHSAMIPHLRNTPMALTSKCSFVKNAMKRLSAGNRRG